MVFQNAQRKFTAPRKRKEPTARNLDVLAASNSVARNLNTSAVPAEEQANELPASVSDFESNSGSTTQDGETQTEFTDHEVYLTEIIKNNNKRIQEMEQEIKRQLQDMQRQNDDLSKILFTLENLKSMYSSAAFYSGFPKWETFMAVYTYLDPGERREYLLLAFHKSWHLFWLH